MYIKPHKNRQVSILSYGFRVHSKVTTIKYRHVYTPFHILGKSFAILDPPFCFSKIWYQIRNQRSRKPLNTKSCVDWTVFLLFMISFFRFWPTVSCKIPRISNIENSKNLQFRKFQKYSIWEIPKISDLESSKNCQFWNFQKFPILKNSKFSKFYNLENYRNSKNFQFYKLSYILIVRIIEININIKNNFENKNIESLFF